MDAAADRVWELLTWPDGLDRWVDADLLSASPTGVAQPAQQMLFTAHAVGRGFPLTITVREVDPDGRRLRLEIDLPFGIRNDETVTVVEMAPTRCLVRFG